MPVMGFQAYFKKHFSGGGSNQDDADPEASGSRSKAKAKPKSGSGKGKSQTLQQPKTGKTKTRDSDQKQAEPKKVDLTTEDRKAKGIKRKRIENPFDEQPDEPGPGCGNLTDGDKTIIGCFMEKIDKFAELAPPKAEGPFKVYMQEVCSQLNTTANEIRTKKKSANRRAKKDGGENAFVEAREEVETKVRDMIHMIKCLLFQVQPADSRSILSVCDDTCSPANVSINSAIMRRALKSLVFEDLKLEQYENMCTKTWPIIAARFVTDDHDDGSAEQFFILTVGQVMMKLVKATLPKLKTKDNLTILILII